MQAGFIGLGTLGKAMAQRMISQGVTLEVWNRTPEKAQGLAADVAASPASLIANQSIVFLNLRDSDAVDAVLHDDNGLLAGDIAGKIIVDTTTNRVPAVIDFEREVRAKGAAYLEAPVAGSVIPASKGALTVFASGEQAVFDEVRPLLNTFAGTVYFLGEIGRATTMKLINNLVLGSFMAVLAEAVALGEAAGFEKGPLLDMLASGAGSSGVLNAKKQKLLDGDFSPHFSAELIYKDLHYMQELARSLQRPLFTGSTAKELYALTFLAGLSEQDFSVLYQVLKSGVQ